MFHHVQVSFVSWLTSAAGYKQQRYHKHDRRSWCGYLSGARCKSFSQSSLALLKSRLT